MNIALFLKVYKESCLKEGFYSDGRNAPLHEIIANNRVDFFEMLIHNNQISKNGEKLNLNKSNLSYDILYRDNKSNSVNDQNSYIQIMFNTKKTYKNSNNNDQNKNSNVDTGYIRYVKSTPINTHTTFSSRNSNNLYSSNNIFDKYLNIKITNPFFYSLFNTNKNERNLFTNEDYKIPERLNITQESAERLFYTLFELQYDIFLVMPFEFYDSSIINNCLLGDLLLQDTFCDVIISKIVYNNLETPPTKPVLEIDNLFMLEDSNLFEISVDLIIKSHHLSKSLKNAIKELSNTHNIKKIGLPFENKIIQNTSSLFKEFLFRLLQLSFSKNQKKFSHIEKTNLIYRYGFISKLDVTYKPLLETIMLLSYTQKTNEEITISLLKKIYSHYAGCDHSELLIDNVINNNISSEVRLFDYIFKTVIEINEVNQIISLKKLDEICWHEYVIENKALHWMYLPSDYQLSATNNLSNYEGYCKSLLCSLNESNSNDQELSRMTLSSFTDGRMTSAFTIVYEGNTINIKANLSPIIRGDFQIAGIPRWAGVYYKFDPVADLTTHNHFNFEIKSSDKTVEYIHVELKNNDFARKEHKVQINLTDDWIKHSINLKQVPNLIMSKLEEICFVITPMSLTSDTLIGNFEIQNVFFD